MKLSIVIPVYNNWNFTKAALKDLSKLPSDKVEVIVVDNASTDQTREWSSRRGALDDDPASLKVIVNKDNKGFSRASNQGYEMASGEYVLFLNNDIRVKSNYDDWVFDLIDSASDGSLVGPTGGLLDKNLAFVKETDKLEKGNFYMSGWCLCAKKEVFDKLILNTNEFKGPFSNEFTSYFEDTDLSFRAKQLGVDFKIVPVPVHHFGRMTGKKLGLSNIYRKSRNIFVNKWLNK